MKNLTMFVTVSVHKICNQSRSLRRRSRNISVQIKQNCRAMSIILTYGAQTSSVGAVNCGTVVMIVALKHGNRLLFPGDFVDTSNIDLKSRDRHVLIFPVTYDILRQVYGRKHRPKYFSVRRIHGARLHLEITRRVSKRVRSRGIVRICDRVSYTFIHICTRK